MFKQDVEHVFPEEDVGHELELVVRLSELRVFVQFPAHENLFAGAGFFVKLIFSCSSVPFRASELTLP
jgi:hypothetical protein